MISSARSAMRAWAVSLILLVSLTRPLLAQQEPAEPEPPAQGSAAAIEEAKVHFERALAAYREGSYEVAIAELERALELDPNGKDLVYNLGLVYEKLGDVDRAIAQFERYLQMETDPSEAERAHVILRRLEGARAEMARKRAQQEASTPSAAREPAPAPPSEPQREQGRLDAWVFAASGVALAATLVGAVFGVRAVAMRPSDDEATGAGTSAADLEQRASDAHALAIVADVAFGVALASAGAGAALYFLREPEPRAAAAGRTLGAKVEVRF